MKIKKVLAVLLIVVMCFVLVACGDTVGGSESAGSIPEKEATNDTAKNDEISPLLYKVTDTKGNVAWLFGSIHIGAKRFYPLPDYVLNALDNSDSLAVEFDIVKYEKDQAAAMEMLAQFVITDGRTIKDFVSDDVYEAGKKVLTENGYYAPALDYYMPIMWSNFIDEFLYQKIDVNIDLGIDRHLIERAYEKDIEILDVESAEFQYKMLAGYSKELQALLLKESIDAYNDLETSKKEFGEKVSVWASGDEKKFAKILTETEFENEQEKKLYQEYNNAMIINRNKSMTDWAENALKSGKEVFICVGAAHIVGPGAMAEMLENRGYTVELVK